MNKKLTMIAATFVLPSIIVVFLPFGLNLIQGILLASVVLAVTWWATNAINKNITSFLLIAVFLVLSGAPLGTIFKFPVSDNFFLIISAFLITEGIVKSNLVHRISESMIAKHGHTPIRLIILSFILGIVLIFVIPQPFPRVIMLSAVYLEFLKRQDIREEAISVILFSIYVASTSTSMFFTTGDILLNNISLQIGEVNLSWTEWAVYMAVPALVISIMMYILFIVVFKKELSGVQFSVYNEYKKSELSIKEKKAIGILSVVLLLWMTEPFHGISAAWVSCLGVVGMYLAGLLEVTDIKKVNVNLLIFLTAAFSIGGVLNYSGAAKVIYSQMMQYMPNPGGTQYFIFIIFVIMVLHLILGSSVTTISVALPGLLSIDNGSITPVIITLITYTVVNIHYILPFHHATIMIGAGENQFNGSHVIKYGIVLTVFIFIAVLFIELPWWRILNLLII